MTLLLLLLVGPAPGGCWPPAAANGLLPKDRILPLPPDCPDTPPLSIAGCLPLQKLLNTRASSGLATGTAGAGATATSDGTAGATTTGAAGRAAGAAAGCGTAADALLDGSGRDAAATSALLSGPGLLAGRPLLQTVLAAGTGTAAVPSGPSAAADGGARSAPSAGVLPAAVGTAGPCGCVRAASSASSSAIWIRICEQQRGEHNNA